MQPRPPKPGDPDWIPRYPPLDLGPIDARIAERQEYAASLVARIERINGYEPVAALETQLMAVEADTAMMVEMRRAIRNLRLANEILKEVIYVNFGRTERHG